MRTALRLWAILSVAALTVAVGRCGTMTDVQRWSVLEVELSGDVEYDALPDVHATVRWVSPSGEDHRTVAFWDGDRTWKARLAPGEVGTWRWRTECSEDAGLHAREGQFECVVGEGTNPVLTHGPLRVADDGHHLEHADGTPFFWLADTAWNGALRAERDDWAEYLDLRRRQGFSAVQFVTTQWRGWPNANVFSSPERVSVNVEAMRRLDEMVAMVNEAGLVAAPVMLWTLTESDPGQVLSEESAILLCRYMRARWGAHNVVWLLGGDGRYEDEDTAARWRRIGRAVFGPDSDRPVTMHPCGMSWVGDQFGDEPWFDFLGYQSGHGLPEKTSRWIAQGPPAQHWRDLHRPIINLEPNYEGHPAYGSDYRIAPRDVRRAAWLSLLVTPTAGVSYGTNPIWVWGEETGDAPGHGNIRAVPPWREALQTEGIGGMSAMRSVMDGIQWWRLRPAQEMVAEQPGADDPRRFIAVAATPQRGVVVAYTPGGDTVRLTGELPATARWYDPRTGGSAQAVGEMGRFDAPDERDWVLVLGGAVSR